MLYKAVQNGKFVNNLLSSVGSSNILIKKPVIEINNYYEEIYISLMFPNCARVYIFLIL